MKQWLSRFSRTGSLMGPAGVVVSSRRFDSIPQREHRFQYAASGDPVVLLFRIGQFRIGDKTRMLLRRVVTLRSPTPTIFHPLLRPEFVHVLGNALDEFVQLR